MIRFVLKFILRVIYRLPNKYKNVWYNRSCYIESEYYPIIFDPDKRYIPCKKGTIVSMGKTKNGKDIYYKVTKCWSTRGGDFLFDSDSINCDLEFCYIK